MFKNTVLFRSSLMAFLLLFCLQLTAQEDKEYPSLLWEIKGPDIETSWLYGTIHIIPDQSFVVSKQLSRRMKKADRLVMEMKLNLMVMLSSASQMMLPRDQSLDKIMEQEDFQRVQSWVRDSMNQALPGFERIKPMFLSQQITTDHCFEGKLQSYEMYFNREFKKMKKPSSGLETAKEQMKFLDDIPLENQLEELMETINNIDSVCTIYDQMLEVYLSQDLDELIRMTSEDESLSESMDQLLNQRNQNWIPKLDKMLKKESLFIAVGAAHLPGPQGVIELLRAEGYTVRPIR